jgi:TP901 family phage tail tape measure protein
MALERYGLGAIITADSAPFVSETDRARDSLGRFISTSNQAPTSISRMSMSIAQASRVMGQGAAQIATGAQLLGTGLRNAALGAIPLALAVGTGVSQAAKFEKQMSAVGAVARASERDMAALNKEAKRMGIVSVFSATQAGEAMEQLARAGANTEQIISALQGTMNAAAADSIDLATASDIVAQTVKSMDLAWSDAAHVADVLALTSASANTNITFLGESFKYGASMAKGLDISLEQTAAIFGKLGDAGLKGSIAGTSFVNMMNKLVKPSEKAEAIMKKWKITLEDSNKELKPVSTIIQDISSKMDAIPSAAERAGLAVEFFGLRGVKAYNALRIQGKEALDELENSLIASSYGIGAATEAAEKRLDNFIGRLTLFGASVESLSIGLFGPLMKSFTPVVEEMTKGLNSVLFSLDALNEIRTEESKQNSESAQLIAKTTSQRLQAAGATDNYARSTRSAIQVLSRMQMSEENLSRAQVEARKRGVLAAFEAESRRRAEMIKTAQIAAAGVKSEEQLSASRAKMINQQIAAMTEARKTEAQKQIDVAFSGAKGSAEAQQWLRKRVLEEALASNKSLTEAQRASAVKEINSMIMLESEASKRADSIRAQIFSIEKLQEIEEKYGSSALQIAYGMQDAIDGLTEAWYDLRAIVIQLGTKLENTFGKEGVRKIAKYATYFAIIAAAIVPIALAVTALSFVLGGLSKVFIGLKTIAMGALNVIRGSLMMLVGAFWPIVIVTGILAVAFALYRKEGESFGDTMVRLWGDIKQSALSFYIVAQRIVSGFLARWNELSDGIGEKWGNLWSSVVSRVENVVSRVKERFYRIFGHWLTGVEGMEINWENFGAAIANGINWVSDSVISVIDTIVSVVTAGADIITSLLEGPLSFVVSVIDTIMEYSGYLGDAFNYMWNSVTGTFYSVVSDVKDAANEIYTALFGSSEGASKAWIYAGKLVGSAITLVLHDVMLIIGGTISAVGAVISSVVHTIKTVVIGVKKVFENVFGGIMQIMEGDFVGGVKRIGTAIFNALTLPIRAALGGLLKLVRKIPYVEEGLGALGVNIKSIQDWIDNGISYQGGEQKGKVSGRMANIAKTAAIAVDEKKKGESVKVNVEGAPDYASQIEGKKSLIESINDLKTQQQRKATETPKIDVGVNLEDKRTLDIKNQMCVDGEGLDVATSRHRQEIQDRAGYKSTPWQRRTMLEHGAAPVKKAAG